MPTSIARALPTLLLVLLLTSTTVTWTVAAETIPRIDAARLRQHVDFLASDRLEGRETGTPGVRMAEEYIHDAFVASGLSPLAGQSDPYMSFELIRGGFDTRTTRVAVRQGDETWEADAEDDFRPFAFSSTGTVSAELVFAGYGITSDEHDWDDYAGLDVEGKVVLLLRYEPGKDDPASPFDGTTHTRHAWFTTKERNARAHGAIGMVVVQGPLHADEPGSLPFPRGLTLASENESQDRLPSVQVLGAWLSRPLQNSDHDLRTLQEAVESGRPPASLPPLGLEITASIESREGEAIAARNVVGVLPGSDPLLSREILVVGAHHDHVGVGGNGSDRIFNGADDNASGTAVLLELARSWASLEPRPARSVVFATFTGEEKGLLGSRALVESGLLPMDRVRFMINLDMVGRNPDRPVTVFADPRAPGAVDLLRSSCDGIDLELRIEEDTLPGNSDHSSFSEADIPVTFFFTGTHADYHRPGDHADRLAVDRMARIGEVTLRFLQELASAEESTFPSATDEVSWLGATLTFQRADSTLPQTATRRLTNERRKDPGPPVLSAVVTAIRPGTQAERAGLRVGDVLTGIGPADVLGSRAAGRRLQELAPGESVQLEVARTGGTARVSVLRPRPGFLGIAYGELTTADRDRFGIPDNEGVVVERIVPDGPAATADLRVGDIILRIEDQPARQHSLSRRVQAIGAANTLEMQILRDGQKLQRRVRLGELPPTG